MQKWCPLTYRIRTKRSFSWSPLTLHYLEKSSNSAHAHWVVGNFRPFHNSIAISNSDQSIYQSPNAQVRNSRILLSNAMAAGAMKYFDTCHQGLIILHFISDSCYNEDIFATNHIIERSIFVHCLANRSILVYTTWDILPRPSALGKFRWKP
jgi:hypothetical protein